MASTLPTIISPTAIDMTKKRKLDENGVVSPLSTPPAISADDLNKILSPFTKDQLLEIVRTASARHPDVLEAVRFVADRDPAQRKLFVRGLGWDTSTEDLRAVFAAYGELDEAVVIMDKATGKSKGFGFVTYKHVDGALLALKEPNRNIHGRMTITQLASAGITGPVGNPNAIDLAARKIYVAGVPQDMPADRLLAHFLSYGEIEEGPLGFDKVTGKSRGYALFIYKTVEAAKAALAEPLKMIEGSQVICRLAIDKRAKAEGQVPNQVGVGGVKVEPVAAAGAQQPQGGMPVGVYANQYNTGVPGGVGPAGVNPHGGFVGGMQQGMGQLGQAQHPMNLNSSLIAGQGLSSLGRAGVGGVPGYQGIGGQAQAPSSLGGAGYGLGGGYSGLHLGGPGSNYGGLGVGLGSAVGSLSGVGGAGIGGATASGLGGGIGGLSGAGLGSSGSGFSGGLGSAGAGLGGAGGGLGVGGGGLGLGAGGIGTGLGGLGRGSMYGLPPSSAGLGSGGYHESAHYSLSSGSGYQSQLHQNAGASPLMGVGMPPYI